MKHISQYTSILLVFLTLVTINTEPLRSQCNNGSQFGTEAAPTDNSTVTISTCSYEDEYSTITNVVSGETYSMNSDCGSYITVRSGSPGGPVVNSGNAPLSWTATSNDDHYIHWNTDSGCGTATACCETTITCTSCTVGGGGSGINMSDGSSLTCSATFYDSNGSGGDYSSNENLTYTICPDVAGNYISADFTFFDVENSYDYLYIYDGGSVTDPLIGAYTGTVGPGVVQASGASGCLTFEFISDGSVTAPGWVADITCTTTGPTCSDGIQNQGETGIDCGGPCPACPPTIIPTVCSNDTYTLPAGSSANFYDDGGPGGDCSTDGAPGNFSNAGCVTTTTICAAPGEFLIADFSVFSMYNTTTGWDWMVIYEGASTSGPILFDNRSGSPDNPVGTDCNYDGSSLNICSIGQCLTFEFNATSVVNKEGWDALVSSVPVACTPLPVELINFSGEKHGNTNELSWITATETNNDYFIVEYSSDGKSWSEIKTISGSGNSSTQNTYISLHRDFEVGVNYYRLRQVDYDGSMTAHGIISIDNRDNLILIKRINALGQEVDETYKGVVFEYYSDGSTRKIMQ